MRFMAVASEDGALEEFAAQHETLGVLACSALDKDLDAVAAQVVELRSRIRDGSVSPGEAFEAVARLDKLLPDEVRSDVFGGLAQPR